MGWKRWLLHLVDMERKKPIDSIMHHWIGAGFGVMEGILSENGGEFSSKEPREVASLLNLEVSTTAADSLYENGIRERIHSVTDIMLLKLEKQCLGTLL